MLPALFFDFDGVILDSVSARDAGFFNLFSDESEDTRRRVVQFHRENPGIDRAVKIERIFREVLGVAPGPDDVSEKVAKFSRLVFDAVLASPFVPGIDRFLAGCLDHPCYIISAARETEIREIVHRRDLSAFFRVVRGSPTPKAALIAELLKAEALDPGDVIFIGDKISDLRAAEANGLRFVGRVGPDDGNPFPPVVPTIADFTNLQGPDDLNRLLCA